LNWQHDPESLDLISEVSCPTLILAIMGQSGGHCIMPADSGVQAAKANSGTERIAARMLAETNFRRNCMLFLYAQLYR
jgi:hypothetical protein